MSHEILVTIEMLFFRCAFVLWLRSVEWRFSQKWALVSSHWFFWIMVKCSIRYRFSWRWISALVVILELSTCRLPTQSRTASLDSPECIISWARLYSLMTLWKERDWLRFLVLELVVESFSHFRILLQLFWDLEIIAWTQFLLMWATFQAQMSFRIRLFVSRTHWRKQTARLSLMSDIFDSLLICLHFVRSREVFV